MAEDYPPILDAAQVDLGRPITATCGSGVSACVLALGLHVLGRSDVAVYDGSWSEWGGVRHDSLCSHACELRDFVLGESVGRASWSPTAYVRARRGW